MIVYQNIGVLNLTKATVETLKGIQKLENIGLLITAKEQTNNLTHIAMENIGDQVVIEGSKDLGIVMRNGEMDIKESFIKDSEKELFFILNGRLIVEDMEYELLKNINGIVLNGQMIAPEKIYGALSHRTKINGEVLTYPEGFVYLKEDFNLQEENLFGLEHHSRIALGSLEVLKEIDRDLVEEKIEKLFIMKELITTKNILRWIAPRIENYGKVAKTIVPEGYDYYEELTINEENLSTFADGKIFVKNKLKVDLPFDKVKGVISDIKGKEIYVPKGEKTAYLEIAGDMEVKTFNPEAVGNYSSLLVDSNYLNGKLNMEIENYGVLEFAEKITEEEIERGIRSIKNYGKIQCSKGIYGILAQKVRENYGVFNKERVEKVKDHKNTIVENMGVLEL